jgi:hypothetical protein
MDDLSSSSSINMPVLTRTRVNDSSATISEQENVAERSCIGAINNTNNRTAAFLLDRFRPCHSPIIMASSTATTKNLLPKKPVRIRILLFEHKLHEITFRKGPTSHIGDEVLNICMDGFARSPYFELVNFTIVPDFTLATNNTATPPFVLPEDEDIVWVVDMRRTVKKSSYTIGQQLVVAANATRQYQMQQRALLAERASLVRLPSLQVVLMDYRDKIGEKQRRLCTKGVQNLIALLGVGNVRSVVQQIVRGREYNSSHAAGTSSNNNNNNKTTTGFVNPGHVWDSHEDNACFGFPTLHVPYTVRSDYVEAIQQYPKYLLVQKGDDPSTTLQSSSASSRIILVNTASTRSAVVETERPMDVAHFWPVIENENCAQLRNAVTKTILALNGTTITTTSTKGEHHHSYSINTFGDFVSKGTGIGRTTVSSSYVQALLTTKIIVVAQRDEWEDHYRLVRSSIETSVRLLLCYRCLASPHQE